MTGQHRSGGTRAERTRARTGGSRKGKGRRYLTAGLLWLAVVGVSAVVAWIAIGSASRSVTAVPLSADRGDAGTGPEKAPTGPLPASGVEGPGAGSVPASSAPSADETVKAHSPTPSATGTSATLTTRTFRVTAGVVTASCMGSRIGLVSAAPTNGWSMAVEASGPAEVEVEFATASAGEVKVEAHCAGGIPAFAQELNGPGGGGSSGPGGGGSGSGGSGGGGGGSSGPGGGSGGGDD
jgi:hypothetical protein